MSMSEKSSLMKSVRENPQLIAQWDAERNAPDQLSDPALSSGDRVWWKCQNGHHWIASIANRAYGKNCPRCTGAFRYIRRCV